MASFAVQAITQVVTRIATWRLQTRLAKTGVDETTAKNSEPPVAHAEYVERHSNRWAEHKGESGESEEALGMHEELLREVLKQAVEMEGHARRLLIANLPNGSKAQVVLKADRSVQLRDIRSIRKKMGDHRGWDEQVRGEHPHPHRQPSSKQFQPQPHSDSESNEGGQEEDALGDPDDVSRPLPEEDTMDEVNKFRESFAALLAAGSRMRRLEGHEKLLMERRTEKKQGEEGWSQERSLAAERAAAENTL